MTKQDLQSLFSRTERQNASVLSVYLNVDQSQQANLNRAFETKLQDMILSIRDTIQDPSEMERFRDAARRIHAFISGYRPQARTLALFADATDGFFWHAELKLPLESVARWDKAAYSEPLATIVDQHKSYGVVLVDRNNLRIFYVSVGEIEECVRKEFGAERTRHIKTSGTDHIGSASQIQRRADEHVRANLRRSVMLVDDFVQGTKTARLLVAGTPEVTTELRHFLPKHVARCVIGTLDLAIDSTPHQVLAATGPIAGKYETAAEIQKVDRLVTAAAKSQKAVVGIGPTLEAVNFGRVWQLLYSNGVSEPGFECSGCQALFGVEKDECPYCKSSVQHVPDVVERTIEHVLRKGADVEVVTGEAAHNLDRAGSIGALLKTRTAGQSY